MNSRQALPAFVRTEEAPSLPPPGEMTGKWRQLQQNYFSSVGSGIVTVLLGGLILLLAWRTIEFALVDAAWSGTDRSACMPNKGGAAGACWPFVAEKFGQWIYGFYPIPERWRINLCMFVGAILLVPMLMPNLPYKLANALVLLIAFPLFTFVMLTGGNFDFAPASYTSMAALMLLAAALIPFSALGIEKGFACNRIGLSLAGIAALVWLASYFAGPVSTFGVSGAVSRWSVFALLIASAFFSIRAAIAIGGRSGKTRSIGWGIVLAGVLAAMLVLETDFGLMPIETSQWGGLALTLVVSVTGITASLPLGILLALGRQSRIPVLRIVSVTFIEVVRGVPLVTVLFMASVMLPLFLPPGMSFDKLLRALVGVALFSAAYMAEVIRGGLQAIPKGQEEGAMALGMSYWQTMTYITLPQALRIVIPNIVGNFISLFKDTTLVLIIGLFDLLGNAQASLRDAAWATPTTAPTGYLVLALIYWAVCFGMSRYAIFTERRLHTGHRT